MKPPIKKATAVYEGKAREINRSDGNRVRKEQDIRGSISCDFPLGDGNAEVTSTRGFKSWFSTRDAGLTVESTVSVTIKCNQSEDDIVLATEQAAILAEQQAHKGAEEMGLYLDAFRKDVG